MIWVFLITMLQGIAGTTIGLIISAVCQTQQDATQVHGCQMAIAGFQIVCVWPFGLLEYGSPTLRCKIGSLPFLGLSPPLTLPPGAIQGKEGINLATLLYLP